ncbi:PAS domain S-box protein [Natrialba swarupiae]|nr:PAS domain S-box protein [Natrialba swarupiae]
MGSPPGRDPLSIEGTHRRKDGSTYPTEVWVNDIELAGETRFIATARDITERKERERELERHKTFVESSDDILTLIDTDGTIEYVSPAIERILGYEPTDLVGRTDSSTSTLTTVTRVSQTSSGSWRRRTKRWFSNSGSSVRRVGIAGSNRRCAISSTIPISAGFC